MNQALQGIKVADFSWIGVGPWTVRFLADHGAEVIHVESTTRPDMLRLTPPFKDRIAGLNRNAYQAKFNVNKYGITLNLSHPRGIEIAKKLVAWADIVAESFRPGQMERWGLGYEEIRKIKPNIIMARLSATGQTGPYSKQPGVGAQLVSLVGFTYLAGWPDKSPSGPYGAYTDTPPPRFAAAAIIAALDYRRRTGKGQCLDLCQFEVGMHFLAPVVMDYMANHHTATRRGNFCPYACPHGAYPCRGEDCWCVIAVSTDAHWHSLCHCLGSPLWSRDERFSTLLGRKSNEDELDTLVATATVEFTSEELMNKLQQSGVPAGVVEKASDLYSDPQLKHRGHFWAMEHPELGEYHPDGPAFKLSKTPAQLRLPPPVMGRDNYYVYTEILGLSGEELAELMAERVLD